MIIVDQLRLSDDATRLYINVHVNKADYFNNVYLESITIITADKVSETNPYEPTEDYIYKKTFDDNTKEADLVLTSVDFTKSWETDAKAMVFPQADMSKTLFFVYFKCKGAVGECTPCGLDKPITIGVTFDEKLLYQRVMDYTKGLADTCNIPVGFTDFILLWNAFKAAIETEHWIPAIKYWKMLFDFYSNDGRIITKGCGCHG